MLEEWQKLCGRGERSFLMGLGWQAKQQCRRGSAGNQGARGMWAGQAREGVGGRGQGRLRSRWGSRVLRIWSQPHENLKSRDTAQAKHLESSRLTPVITGVPLGTCL